MKNAIDGLKEEMDNLEKKINICKEENYIGDHLTVPLVNVLI